MVIKEFAGCIITTKPYAIALPTTTARAVNFSTTNVNYPERNVSTEDAVRIEWTDFLATVHPIGKPFSAYNKQERGCVCHVQDGFSMSVELRRRPNKYVNDNKDNNNNSPSNRIGKEY